MKALILPAAPARLRTVQTVGPMAAGASSAFAVLRRDVTGLYSPSAVPRIGVRGMARQAHRAGRFREDAERSVSAHAGDDPSRKIHRTPRRGQSVPRTSAFQQSADFAPSPGRDHKRNRLLGSRNRERRGALNPACRDRACRARSAGSVSSSVRNPPRSSSSGRRPMR